MPRFESLEAWQKAHRLALAIYSLSQKLPEDEKFGLQGQMRRAGVSAARFDIPLTSASVQ